MFDCKPQIPEAQNPKVLKPDTPNIKPLKLSTFGEPHSGPGPSVLGGLGFRMKDLGFRVQDEGLRVTVKTLYKNPVLNIHYL